MGISRRKFIRNAARSALVLGVGGGRLLRLKDRLTNAPVPSVRSSAISGNPLRIPPHFTGSAIEAQTGRQEVWPGSMTDVWTYGNEYPAPTIRLRSGDQFNVRFTNHLAEASNIHWHGLVIPADMDGHPKDAVAPNGTFDYSFQVNQRAGTYWYHPHPDMRTAAQVYKGMAGFFIVEDAEEQALGLPSGEFDVPLLIQDRLVGETHAFEYAPDNVQKLNGFLGDTILVNGTPEAFLQVAPNLYRFRILNGSNARTLKIGFEDGHTFFIIGTDGGLLDHPYEVDAALLGVAERLDILVDFSGYAIGSSAALKTLEFNGATTFSQQGFEMSLLRFDVTKPAGEKRTMPATLVSLEKLDPASAALTRVIELQTNPGGNPFHHINGRVFSMDRIDAEVKLGDVEIWEIRNLHIMPHPVHIHGAQFQVLERRNGLTISARDYGWKDTVLVWGNETVRIIVRFAPYRGTYLFHCHNLEHEDGGMMINYAIGDQTVSTPIDPSSGDANRIDLR